MALAGPARSTASTTSHNVRQQHPTTLAKRLLFPPGSDVPPLFLSPACPPELNDEVYDFIALALRAFVHTWWTKISRYDKEFLPQITSIVIHVVRALERRILDADLSLLVLVDVPTLVTQHYRDYRQAASKVSTSYATGGASSLPQLFHQLQSHMAISSDGSIDEEYFRQMFDYILRECLPPEDYAPEAERFIVREIILRVVVKDVIPRITQPWFIHKMMLDTLGPRPDASEQLPASAPMSKSSIIVLLLSAIQRLSGLCIMLIHTYKQVVYIIPIVNKTSYPPRRESDQDEVDTPSPSVSPAPSTGSIYASTPKNKYPDLTRGPLEMMSEVLRVQDRLAATVVVQLLSLFCRGFQTFMNKLLCYVLYAHVLSTTTILSVVRVSKRTLFPNGYPGAAPADPTAEEQVVLREELVKRLSERVAGAESVVDGMSEEVCNRHLAVFLLDAVVLSLFPEMGS